MSFSQTRFIKRCAEFLPQKELSSVPSNTRGIYVLLKKEGKAINVVYVGMARGKKSGMHSRLDRHAKSKHKASYWTHFSIYEAS